MTLNVQVNTLDDLAELLDRARTGHGGIADFLSINNSYNNLVQSLKASLGNNARSKLLEFTDEWSINSNLKFDTSGLSDTQLSNALLFFPSAVSLDDAENIPGGLGRLDTTQADRMLLRRENLVRLVYLIERQALRPGQLSSELLLELAFAATAYRVANEESLLRCMIELCTQGTWHAKSVRRVLRTRISALRGAGNTFQEKNNGRVAVIVAGQMRGMERSLPALAHALGAVEADVFVSTWSRPGRIRLDRARARRIFTGGAADQLLQLTDNQIELIDDVIEAHNNIDAEDIESMIRNTFRTSKHVGSVLLNIEDPSKTIFALMSNAEKMHYHNMFWPLNKGPGYFSDRYDYIIKVRPDVRYDPNHQLSLDDLRRTRDQVATESLDWKFESWGIGAGDQLLYGNAQNMESVLSIWPGHCRSTSIRTGLRGKVAPLIGHSNIGIELWLRGVDVVSSSLKHRGYHGEVLMDHSDLAILAREAGVKLSNVNT